MTANISKAGEKGSKKMQGQPNLKRTLVTAFAAVLMSSVAVGSAVAPAHVSVAPAKYVVHA
jgi:hypothetical protein